MMCQKGEFSLNVELKTTFNVQKTIAHSPAQRSDSPKLAYSGFGSAGVSPLPVNFAGPTPPNAGPALNYHLMLRRDVGLKTHVWI